MGQALDVLKSPSFLLGMAILVALFLLGYGLMVWVRRWVRELNATPRDTAAELEHYRQLREQGELSDREYEEISRLLAAPPMSAPAGDSEQKAIPPEGGAW